VEGSRRLAQLVAEYLRTHAPLARQPRTSRRSMQSRARLAALSTANAVKASW
jgi:hypothetical protein